LTVYKVAVRLLEGGFLLALALLAGAAVCSADEQAPPQAALRPASAAAVSPASEDKLRAAFDHLYNLEFHEAIRLFEQVAGAEPESATVCSFWSSAILYEILARQGTLQSQLFVTSNEFLRHQRIPPDPQLDQHFHSALQQAEQRAQRRLQRNPTDVDGLFAMGLTRGNMANYLAGVKTDYIKGLRAGEESYEYMQKVRTLYPDIHDAGLVLGVHDYVIGSLPRSQRFLLFFLGSSGNRERGLMYLQEAAEKGEFLRTYSQVLMVVANVREGRRSVALQSGQSLLERYPRNPVFMLEVARLYRENGRHRDAMQLCRLFIVEMLAHPHSPRILGPEDGLIELARVEAAQNSFDRALETLARVKDVPNVNPRVAAQALLERGKILDQLGKRELALAEYQKVVQNSPDPDVTKQARAYQKRPYRPGTSN